MYPETFSYVADQRRKRRSKLLARIALAFVIAWVVGGVWWGGCR